MFARSLRSLVRFGYRCTNEIHQNESSSTIPPDLLSPISVMALVLSVYCARLTDILVFYHFHHFYRKSERSCLLCRRNRAGKLVRLTGIASGIALWSQVLVMEIMRLCRDLHRLSEGEGRQIYGKYLNHLLTIA